MIEKDNAVKIDTTEVAKKPIYSNVAMIRHSEGEISFDFAMLQPDTNTPPALVRILTSPVHAKRLLAALADNLTVYEARFGEIKLWSPPEPKKELVN